MSKKNRKISVVPPSTNGSKHAASNGTAPKFLSQNDLMEYLLQFAVVNNVNNNLQMVKAAYQITVNNIKDKYGIKSSKYEIDRQSGEIKELPDA